ncbi:MAG TPA: DUF3383 domain-containing protein [Burkholderiaceae bacterium]
MTASIPAAYFVEVTPSVIKAGGNALVLNGVVLTESTRAPLGAVLSFASADGVAAYFGDSSVEAQVAAIYFNGFDNSDVKPGSILFTQYNASAVAGWMRGGTSQTPILSELQALSGVLTLTVDGTPHTSSNIDLSAATSFSNAATIIQAAFTSPGFTVSFDSVSAAFVFTSNTTGASSSVSVATGSLAAGLALTTATGAVTSPGAAAAVPGTFMDGIKRATQNWATFMTAFDPDGGSGNTVKQAFAAWVNSQNKRFIYVAWDDDVTPTESTSAAASLGAILVAANSEATCPIYGPTWDKAAFICGSIASIDFTRTNGRPNFAYRSQDGLPADVTSDTVAANLQANGYNFYGAVATANQGFEYFYPGSVTGTWSWLDSLVCEIWLNNALQLALLTLLTIVKSIPYNQAGYALIRAACMDPINAALNFGAIRAGVTLTAQQIAEVNNQAGTQIDQVLSTRGWYLQVNDASGTTRAARSSPPITLWYMDGDSVNKLSLSSIAVQ